MAEQKVILPAEKPAKEKTEKKIETPVVETARDETHTASAETTEVKAEADKPVKDQRNGITRPKGALTGKVWVIADAITSEKGRPALRKEVWTRYQAEVGEEKAQESTSYTQYSRWVKYHGFNEQVKNIRAGLNEAAPAPAAA